MAITARQMKHASATQLTPDQQLAYFLTPQQQQEIFDRRQQAQASQTEADISDQESKANYDRAMAALNHARAQQAQSQTDELIARGMLQSGTAAGALADIEIAAMNQRQALDTALQATLQRNIAARSNAQAALDRLAGYAQGTAAENIASGVRSMPGQQGATTPQTAAPAGLPAKPAAAAPAPASKPASNVNIPSSGTYGFGGQGPKTVQRTATPLRRPTSGYSAARI